MIKNTFLKAQRCFLMRMIPLLFMAALASSCSVHHSPDLPSLPMEKGGVYHVDRFIWFDLLTDDIEEAQQFYAKLFNWTFSPDQNVRDYFIIMNDKTPIGGMIDMKNQGMQPDEARWISTFSIQDVDQAAERIKGFGGEIISPPIDAGPRGRMALVKDPAGAEFVIQRSLQGDPPRYERKSGNPVWIDLFTRDLEQSATFYDAFANFEHHPFAGQENHYYFSLNGKIRAGIVVIPWDDVTPNWLPFIGVDNLRTAVKNAVSHGATLAAYTEDAAVILDPTGAALGLQLLPLKTKK